MAYRRGTLLVAALVVLVASGPGVALAVDVSATGSGTTPPADTIGVVGGMDPTDAPAAVNNTTDTLTNTTDNTTDSLNDTTGTLEDTTDDTTSTLADTTNDTTSTLADTTDDTTSALSTGISGTGGLIGVVGSLDDSATTNATATPASGGDAAGSGDGTAWLPGPLGGAGGVPPAGGAALVGAGTVGAGLLARRSGTLRRAAAAATHSAPEPVAWLRDWLRRLAGLAGYQRYADDDPLEHDTRAAIYEHLRESPGAYLSAVADAVDAPLSTVRYHLSVLEFENLVRDAEVRGRRRYFPLGTDPNALDAALADDAPTAVLAALARDGPDSVSGLAETLDRDPSTVTHHLQRLADDGLVERERDGRAVVNRAVPAVEAALEPSPGEDDAPAGQGAVDAD